MVAAERAASPEIAVETIGQCRACGSPDLAPVLSLGAIPLTAAFVTEAQLSQPEPVYPLETAFCQACTLMQVTATVPPDVIFSSEYPYYSSFSDALLAHARENVARLIRDRGLTAESLAIEVASNDGYLLRWFAAAGVPVLGIDPADGPARAAIDAGIPTMIRFFGAALAEELRAQGRLADVLIANNVLAHVPDPNGFVAGIATVLKPDGVAVIEVPYVLDLIERCEFDTIYHEHFSYFSVCALNALFARHGLSLNRVEHLAMHGGSLRLYVGHTRAVERSVRDALDHERRTGADRYQYYGDFTRRVAATQAALSALLHRLKAEGASIAAYGAAAKGVVFLNAAGIGADVIDYVVDRNTHKQGLFMPGVHIPVRDPAALLSLRPDYVLMLAWNFAGEILEQQAEFRQHGGKFIIPIPIPTIV